MVDNNIPPNKARKSQNYHPHAHLQHRCQQYNYCHYRQNSIETAPKSKIWQNNQTNTKMYINMTKCAEIVVMFNALQTLPATHKTKHLFCKHFQIASNDAVCFLNWKFLIFFVDDISRLDVLWNNRYVELEMAFKFRSSLFGKFLKFFASYVVVLVWLCVNSFCFLCCLKWTLCASNCDF